MQEKKIKSVSAKRFNYIEKIDQEFKIVEVPSSFREFDISGNIISDIHYNSEGAISEKNEFDFEGGKLIEKRLFLDEVEVAEVRKYFYNQHANIDFVMVEYTDETEEKIIYTYDANQNLISKKPEEEEGGFETMKYENNLLVFHQVIDDFEEIEKEERRFYSADGNLSKIELIRFEEGEQRNIEINFDEKGKILLEEVKTLQGKSIEKKVLTYNESGSLTQIHTILTSDENFLIFEYDAFGNEILQVEKDSEGKVLHQVNRSYDEFNNVLSADVEIFNFGKGLDYHYKIEYSYLFF